jgi:hypothetical protein
MKCCICGTVKNCGPYLDKVFENIEKIGSLFDDYKIILYYDESEDDTLNKINNYQKKNHKLLFHVNKRPFFKHRTYNISRGRNFCLKYIRKNLSEYEMFIMMDMDDVSYKEINLEPLKDGLKREDWDSLSFNTSPNYYDIWALSINPYYLSCFAFKKKDEMIKTMMDYVTDLLKNLKPGNLLPCASAFNGFAIYRTNKFINCNYDGRLRLDLLPFGKVFKNNNTINSKFIIQPDDCEHRAFHLEAILKNNARIRISPEIIFT